MRLERERYTKAQAAFRATWEEHFEKYLTGDDPTLAIQQARRVESQALEEYMRVLKVFTDLVLRARIPTEEP